MIGQQTPPLGPEDFASAESRALLAELQVTPMPGDDLSPEDRLAELPPPLDVHARSLVAEVLGKPPLPDEKLTKDLVDSLLRLRERNLGAQIQNVKSLIQENERAGAADDREGRATVARTDDRLLGPETSYSQVARRPFLLGRLGEDASRTQGMRTSP